MSNARKIDLAKLAAALTGQQPVRRPAAPVSASAFPRIPLARIEELLGDETAVEETLAVDRLVRELLARAAEE